MKEINENNINDFIKDFFIKDKDWSIVLNSLSEMISKKNGYQSIKNNYLALFIYYLIENKIEIDDFDKVVAQIYNKTSMKDLGDTFHRFFHLRHSTINLSEVVKGEDIWDDLCYVFCDQVNDDIIINKKTEPYFLSLLKLIPRNKVGGIYEGSFIAFLVNLETNSLKNVFETIENNDSFLDSLPKYFNSFFYSYIDNKTASLYTLSEDKKISEYNKLNNNIKFFSEKLKKIVVVSDDEYVIKVSLSIVNFLIGVKVDVISLLNDEYLKVYSKLQKDNLINDRLKGLKVVSIFSDLLYPLKYMIYKSEYTIDFKNMDVNKSEQENWMYLLSLCDKIKKDEDVFLSKEQIVYINKICNDKKKQYDNFNEINKELLSLFILKEKMSNELKINSVSIKKPKI